MHCHVWGPVTIPQALATETCFTGLWRPAGRPALSRGPGYNTKAVTVKTEGWKRKKKERKEWAGVARENNSPCYSNSGVNLAHADMTPNVPEYVPHNTLEWVPGDFIFKIQYIYNMNWIYKNWINENCIYKPNKLLNIYLINIKWINVYVYKLNTYQIHILNKYIST